MINGERRSVGYVVGAVAGYGQAAACSWLAVSAGLGSVDPLLGWIPVSVIALSAWAAAFAWTSRNRFIAVPGFLITFFAPWGFIYFGPINALVLGISGVFLKPRATKATG